MVFSSLEFLFLFLPIVVAIYLVAPRRTKNAVLLAASLLFYTWGGGALVLILIASIAVDFAAGTLAAEAYATKDLRKKRLAIGLSVAVNLALLSYFKYANFVVEQLNQVGERFGFGPIAWTSVVLPIGISFFTFQSMSYTIDVARGRAPRLDNPIDFGLYVSLFPQLIAGPIVRYHELADQIRERQSTVERIAQGVVRFSHGLVKKVVVADAVASVADAAFGADAGELGMTAAWIGALAYTLQIYFDFSGYSDMAIGLGMIFGFTFPENFNRPYSALSITDFWRRWHITLSNWFRDYVYIPLGGSRSTATRTYVNLWIVFVLTGIWHGANWTFLVWGLYHGGLLVVERLLDWRRTGDQADSGSGPQEWLRRAAVVFAVMIGWVLFRADGLGAAADYLQAMFTFGTDSSDVLDQALTNKAAVTLILASAVFFVPRSFVGGPVLAASTTRAAAAGRAVVLLVGLPYAVILIASGSFSPFLYFQF